MHTHKRRIGHTLMAGGVFLWLSLSVAVNFTPTNSYAVAAIDVFNLSNAQRTNNGLNNLANNAQLEEAAKAKANHMLNNGYFAHTAPDGTTGWNFIDNAGYGYVSAAENLATSNQGAEAVVQGWMNSPGHRDNLLSSTYKEVGYGSVFVGDWEYEGSVYSNTYFVVALYGLSSSNTPVEAPASAVSEPSPPSQPVDGLNQETVALGQQTEDSVAIGQAVEVRPLSDPSEAGVTSRFLEERTSGTAPVASLVPTDKNIIGARTAIVLATFALTAVASGIILEIRWIKHHSHMSAHLPHLHHS